MLRCAAILLTTLAQLSSPLAFVKCFNRDGRVWIKFAGERCPCCSQESTGLTGLAATHEFHHCCKHFHPGKQRQAQRSVPDEPTLTSAPCCTNSPVDSSTGVSTSTASHALKGLLKSDVAVTVWTVAGTDNLDVAVTAAHHCSEMGGGGQCAQLAALSSVVLRC